MEQEPISPEYRDKLTKDLEDMKHEHAVMLHREKDKAKDILLIEQDMRDIINGIKTDRTLDERQEARRVTTEVMVNAGVRAKELVIEYQETMAELSRVELALANLESLGSIKSAVKQGAFQNWIMIVIAGFMAVMTVMTYQNSISIREQAETTVTVDPTQDDPAEKLDQ